MNRKETVNTLSYLIVLIIAFLPMLMVALWLSTHYPWPHHGVFKYFVITSAAVITHYIWVKFLRFLVLHKEL